MATTPVSPIGATPEDTDPAETTEWLDALHSAIARGGAARGLYLLDQLQQQAHDLGIVPSVQPFSAYRNTIALEHQGAYPGKQELEERLTASTAISSTFCRTPRRVSTRAPSSKADSAKASCHATARRWAAAASEPVKI